MPKASPIQTSFNAGELSPTLKGRSDLGKYANGCETLLNFRPLVHGPISKRAGTKFVKEVKDSSKATVLKKFEFSTTQAYILEFGHQYIRFYKDGGNIESGGSPYEIATGYDSTLLSGLDLVQSADVIYIAHKSYPPRKLSRLADDNWTIADVTFDWPPFQAQNVGATTISTSATTGSGVTLTASASTFVSTDVGRHVKFVEDLESLYDDWTSATAVTSGDYRIYDGALYQSGTTGTTGTRAPIHNSGTVSDGAVNWTYIHDGQGYAKITAYSSGTSVTADIISRVPESALSGVTTWSLGAWSSTTGYPRAVTFYEDRLWFAGTTSQPQTLWASRTADYENHKAGVLDDDALNYTINARDMNTIEWLAPGKVLAVGTAGGEFTISASDLSSAITPTDIKILPQTNYGNAGDIPPVLIGGSVLFVQRAKKKIREYAYNFNKDSYVAANLNVLADHITDSGVVDMIYQQEPYQTVWCVRSDGKLAALTYEPSEEVVGWHLHDVGGSVESVEVIPHWDGDQDSLWMVVNRTINGATKRYIEYVEKEFTDEYSFYVDSGLTYDGSPTTSISGLSHLEGETVEVLIDGATHPQKTVSSGAITLDRSSSVVNVGLPLTATVKTMPLEAGAADGTAQGKTMRITNLKMRLKDTGAGLYYGPNTTLMDEFHVRVTGDLMDNPVPLWQQDTPLLPWPEGYETEAQVTVQHRLPLPCTVIAMMPQVHTYDR